MNARFHNIRTNSGRKSCRCGTHQNSILTKSMFIFLRQANDMFEGLIYHAAQVWKQFKPEDLTSSAVSLSLGSNASNP